MTARFGLFSKPKCRWILLVFLLQFAAGCRIEKRIVEVSLEVPEQQGFSFAPDSAGMGGQAVQWQGSFAFGHANRIITPQQSSALAGYGGLGRRLLPPRLTRGADPSVFCRPFDGVDSEPRVKVALFQGKRANGTPDAYILASFDLVAVTQDFTQALLGVAEQSLGEEFDLGHGNFQVTATHTHSGPSGLSTSPIWGAFACDSYRREYRAQVTEAFREALLEAKTNAQVDLQVRVRESSVSGEVESRYVGMPVDDRVSLLTIDKQGSIQGCMFTYSAHSTYFGPDSLQLSTDLAGRLEMAVAERLGTQDCFFLNGSGGNAVARYSGRTLDNYARDVADRIVNGLGESLLFENSSAFSYAAISYQLPEARINFSACRASAVEPFVSLPILRQFPRQTKLAIFSFGSLMFVLVPAELVKSAAEFLEQEIQSQFPGTREIRFVTTANDYGGYILPPALYSTPAIESCSSIYGSSHLESLQSAAKSLAKTFSVP